ncbi:FGGY-family carbohydrate kinase [Olsenella sp. Marseille-QA0557]|uniref:FGGY-family carbohydrate kinase n=1 Tax=Olsenella sp. Marseille-QA0557 TaxID=3378782 RepID=UPI003D127AA4
MSAAYFMGIDTGTSETKGVLIDVDANIVASSSAAHDIKQVGPNAYDHDAEKDWWGDFCKVSRDLIEKSGVDPTDIKCVTTSALGLCCVAVDENCVPTRPAISYGIDGRAEKQMRDLEQEWGQEFIDRVFGRPLCSSDVPPKIRWIQENDPDAYERTAKFINSSTYITAKLTGEYYIDTFLGMAGGFKPLYGEDGHPTEETCKGICRPDQLATIAEETDIIGHVTAEAAAATGLAEGTPVTPGGDDSACEAISCGIGKQGDLIVQFGSTIYMFLLTDHLVMDPRVWHEEFIIPGTCDVSGATNTAGSMTKWLRDTMFQDLKAAEEAGGENAYTVMAQLAEQVPVGSHGLICLPYFAGERTPIDDPNARGAFFGLTIGHTREDMLRAGLEGVAYSINQHFRIFEEDGVPIHRVLVAGGGTKNHAWMQIVADVCGKTLLVPEVTIGASYGDAMMAAVAAGYWKDFDELASKVKIASTYEPNPENHEAYKKYQKLFDELYPATRDIVHQL